MLKLYIWARRVGQIFVDSEMKKLILYTTGCAISVIFLIVLPLVSSVSWPLHFILIILATMNAWLSGRGVAEIINQWKSIKLDRRFEKFSWHRRMGLFETSLFIEPRYTKQHWIVK